MTREIQHTVVEHFAEKKDLPSNPLALFSYVINSIFMHPIEKISKVSTRGPQCFDRCQEHASNYPNI